jgi:serine/threonine-protein kinase
VCSKHLHATPEPPSQHAGQPLPADLEALVLRCLAKRPEDRPESARALERALARCAVEPWTDDDAEQWWRERAKPVRDAVTSRRAPGTPQAGPRTIAVDKRRAPHPGAAVQR